MLRRRRRRLRTVIVQDLVGTDHVANTCPAVALSLQEVGDGFDADVAVNYTDEVVGRPCSEAVGSTMLALGQLWQVHFPGMASHDRGGQVENAPYRGATSPTAISGMAVCQRYIGNQPTTVPW